MTTTMICSEHLVLVEHSQPKVPKEDVSKSATSRIRAALQTIFAQLNIRDRDDLLRYRAQHDGTNRHLYDQVNNMAPDAWSALATPKSTVRANYERMLPGYKIY